jgi:hypothetical protein
MLYESIVKRGSLMVVPSGLADSLNVPSLLGAMGGFGLAPRDGVAVSQPAAEGEAAGPAKEPRPDAAAGERKGS